MLLYPSNIKIINNSKYMYLLFGQENIKNIYSLSSTVINGKLQVSSVEELKFAFLNFLRDFQPQVPKPRDCRVNIIDDKQIEDALAKLYSVDSKLNDRAQSQIIGDSFSKEEKLKRAKLTQDALEILKNKSSEFFSFLELAIHSIFFRDAQRAAGGSTSSGLGIIWLNIKDSLKVFDVVELIVHELAHNYLFIDELCYKHYNYQKIYQEKNYAISSILKTPRPLDKVIHSIIVSSEIILSRRSFLGENNVQIHPSTNQMIEDAKKSIDSVFAMPNLDELVTSRIITLLNHCKHQIQQASSLVDSKIAI